MAKHLARSGIQLLILFYGVTVIEGQSSDGNTELLKELTKEMDASIALRSKLHQELKAESEAKKNTFKQEIAAKFEAILKTDSERHNEMKTSLEKILEFVGGNELDPNNLEMIKYLSERMKVTTENDYAEFNSLKILYAEHQQELKAETVSQVANLDKRRKEQATELRNLIQKVLYSKMEPKTNCHEIYKFGAHMSGIYNVRPTGLKPFPVYCDMDDTSATGWTVIQRRGQFEGESVNFNRSWEEYKNGFGNLSGEFWLGNEKIHFLTKKDGSELQISYKRTTNETGDDRFFTFLLQPEVDSYKPVISDVPMRRQFSDLNGGPFNTYDRNSTNCYNGAGWWYKPGCPSLAHLNGPKNVEGKYGFTANGFTPLVFSTMKIKPKKK